MGEISKKIKIKIKNTREFEIIIYYYVILKRRGNRRKIKRSVTIVRLYYNNINNNAKICIGSRATDKRPPTFTPLSPPDTFPFDLSRAVASKSSAVRSVYFFYFIFTILRPDIPRLGDSATRRRYYSRKTYMEITRV